LWHRLQEEGGGGGGGMGRNKERQKGKEAINVQESEQVVLFTNIQISVKFHRHYTQLYPAVLFQSFHAFFIMISHVVDNHVHKSVKSLMGHESKTRTKNGHNFTAYIFHNSLSVLS
jgi:hypothetical protein